MTDELLLARLPLSDRLVKQPTTPAELPPAALAKVSNPDVLTEHGLPYLDWCWASTDRVDTYGTRMRPSSLKNYAADASAGIALCNSHRTTELPFGQTYAGAYQPGTPGRTRMDFYIPPGLNINGVNTTDVIKAIMYGTARDVSIGFYGGRLHCSLCGKPMLSTGLASLVSFGPDAEAREQLDPSAPCHHIPGLEFAERDIHGQKTGRRAIAIGDVEDAHCAEVSLVFDGSTPEAKIGGRMVPALAKARRLEELDQLPPRLAFELEQRFPSVRFAAARHSWPGVRKDTRLIQTPAPAPKPAAPAPVSELPKLSRFQRLMTLAGRVR